MKKKKKSSTARLKKPFWENLNELWLGVFGLLAFFTMVEVLHVHYHHKAAPHCASELSLAVKL